MTSEPALTRTPIFTSIPGKYARFDSDGRDIGDAHLTACIASWRNCGFEPVTVNSRSEVPHPLVAELGVRTVVVDRDASKLTGRPHLYMSDLVDAALRHGGERVFLVNADIELEMTGAAQNTIRSLRPMDIVWCSRIDYRVEKDPDRPRYEGGIDFFSAGRRCLSAVDFGELVFGMPWWDHFLPLALLTKGGEPVSETGIHPYHLEHGGRWIRKNHIAFGRVFMRQVDSLAASDGVDPVLKRHLDRIRGIWRGRPPDAGAAETALAFLVARLPLTRGLHLRRSLRDISLENEVFFRGLREDARTGQTA